MADTWAATDNGEDDTMKKILFGTMISVLMAMTGCQNEEQDMPDAGRTVMLAADIEGTQNARVVLTPDTDNDGNPIVKVAWRDEVSSNPETFTLYDKDAHASIFTQTEGNKFRGTVDCEGPYRAVYGEHTLVGNEITTDFSRQDGALDDGDFLMVAEDIAELNQRIEFKHKTAILKVTFKLDGQDVDTYVSQFTMNGVSQGVAGNSITVERTAPLNDDIYVFLPVMEAYEPEHSFSFTVGVGGGLLAADAEFTGSITIPDDMTIEAGKFYTATVALSDDGTGYCNLPTGSEFNAAVKQIMEDSQVNVTSLVFKAGQTVAGATRIGNTRAMAKVEGSTLTIYTAKSTFKFNSDSKSMFEGLNTLKTIDFERSINTGGVAYMDAMFKDCSSLVTVKFPEEFSTMGVWTMTGMFENCRAITALYLNDFEFFIYISDMSNMFKGCASLRTIQVDSDKFKTGTVIDMSGMFEGCTSLNYVLPLDVSYVKYMTNMFKGCTSLTAFEVNWSESNNHFLQMGSMFADCTQLKKVSFGANFRPAVTNMSYMFDGCTALEEFTFYWDQTPSTLSMNYMFHGCTSLKNFSADLNGTNKVQANHMFDGCSKLYKVAFTYNSTSGRTEITHMNAMFKDCFLLSEIDLKALYPSTSMECENAFVEVGSEYYAKTFENTKIYIRNNNLKDYFDEQDNTGIDRIHVEFVVQ